MTLKELFCSVQFDDILPIIIDYDPQIAESILSLKQAFDSIRIITPCEDEPKEIIEVSYFNDVNESEGISVRNCSNDRFKIVAGRHVRTAENLRLSLNELAAYCLWELTYWGFSEEDVEESFQIKSLGRGSEARNCYEQEYAEKSAIWFPPINVSPTLVFQEKPKNRLKRKRDYRREQRLRLLLRYAKIEELCQYVMAHNVTGVSPDDLWSLKEVTGLTVTTDRSFSADERLAEEYMCELYEKYGKTDCDNIRSIAIITGGRHVSGNLFRLKESLENILPNAIIGTGDRQEAQIKVIMISVLSAQRKTV